MKKVNISSGNLDSDYSLISTTMEPEVSDNSNNPPFHLFLAEKGPEVLYVFVFSQS